MCISQICNGKRRRRQTELKNALRLICLALVHQHRACRLTATRTTGALLVESVANSCCVCIRVLMHLLFYCSIGRRSLNVLVKTAVKLECLSLHHWGQTATWGSLTRLVSAALLTFHSLRPGAAVSTATNSLQKKKIPFHLWQLV